MVSNIECIKFLSKIEKFKCKNLLLLLVLNQSAFCVRDVIKVELV